MHNENWDDLRFILAVVDHGSVSAAARKLGVNHATVLRRVSAFESRHGGAFFEKSPRGYTVLPDREKAIIAAREAEAAMHSVGRMIEGAQTPLSGRVRVTSTDTFCLSVLPSLLAGLRIEAPQLCIELVSLNTHVDLARMDADITVRPAAVLPDNLTGAVCAKLGFAVYAAQDGADLWLAMNGTLAGTKPAAWLKPVIAPQKGRTGADSFVTLREMAAAGLGRAILPCVLGDCDARIRRIPPSLDAHSVDIWVASHTDLANVPRVRAVRDYLCRALAAQTSVLAGQANG